MSHDLQFQVQNNDGTFSNAVHDQPLPQGTMNQFPAQQQQQQPTTGQPVASAGVVDYVANKLSQSSHPTVIIFHFMFKIVSIFLYVFANWFIGKSEGGFITWSVIVILLLAADFWVVKNITGRLLVGLRWWNKVDNDTTTWVFESAEQHQQAGGRQLRYQVNPFDKNMFWSVLYATPVVWTIFFGLAVFSFRLKWLLVDGMAVALSAANVYGYYKCSSDQKARFQQMMQQGAQQGALAMMRGNVMAMLTGVRQPQQQSGSNTYV